MMPHWPDVLGLNFLHLPYGTDSERLRCYGAFHELLGLDWMPIPEVPTGQDKRYRVATEEDVPVLVDIVENTRHRGAELLTRVQVLLISQGINQIAGGIISDRARATHLDLALLLDFPILIKLEELSEIISLTLVD